jgi:SAM-dependent methyltransferase
VSAFDHFAHYYDADYSDVTDDIAFYQELARRCDDPIIELMCGSGRLLLPLAQAGHRLTGVDISPAMLALARAKLADAGLSERVTLVEGDIRTSAPAGAFGLAIIGLNSFMHLTTTADQFAALGHIHAALATGGLLVLDLFNPDLRTLADAMGQLVLEKRFLLADGTIVHKFITQQTDTAAQLSYVSFIYDELDAEGRVRRSALPFTMRWLYRYELEHLLARAGFELEALYGSYELDAYSGDSELMLAVARRI